MIDGVEIETGAGATAARGLTRRDLLRAGAGVAAAGLAARSWPAGAAAPRPAPAAAGAAAADVGAIEHVIIWMQENRSFDHYFGTYPGVRGFGDPHALRGVFDQRDSKGPHGLMRPFHLSTQTTPAECLADIAHDWGDQHTSWNDGAMNEWGKGHEGDVDRAYMGYYTRSDLPYFYSVADEFTLCDAYHCSVMGSTTSNRLYAFTGMLDPEGRYGGPILSTQSIASAPPQGKRKEWGIFSAGWRTYPELLTEAGISWKVYANPDGDDQYNPLYLFQQYWPQNYVSDPGAAARAAALQAGLAPQFPENFLADLAAGTLPAVSWLIPPILQSEHPSGAPQDGEALLSVVVEALGASPLWSKLAMFFTYDENGGFFDHVPPPTAPRGTPGEYVKGEPSTPIGLGFRVPTLVISPFSRGGFVCRDQFDHTSLLRFLETRFGVPVPNLSAWRRRAVGDLTTAFNFARPDFSRPSLGVALPDDPVQHPECVSEEVTSSPYPTPSSQGVPPQEPGTRPSPSGPVRRAS